MAGILACKMSRKTSRSRIRVDISRSTQRIYGARRLIARLGGGCSKTSQVTKYTFLNSVDQRRAKTRLIILFGSCSAGFGEGKMTPSDGHRLGARPVGKSEEPLVKTSKYQAISKSRT